MGDKGKAAMNACIAGRFANSPIPQRAKHPTKDSLGAYIFLVFSTKNTIPCMADKAKNLPLPVKSHASKRKPANSKSPSKPPQDAQPPKKEHVKQLEKHLRKMLSKEETELTKLPLEDLKASESWLDWGLRMVKEYGPTLLELAPSLLALL